MIQVRMTDKPGASTHEVPWLRTQVKTDLELRDAPVGLYGRARIAFDCQIAMLQLMQRDIVEHWPTINKRQGRPQSTCCQPEFLWPDRCAHHNRRLIRLH